MSVENALNELRLKDKITCLKRTLTLVIVVAAINTGINVAAQYRATEALAMKKALEEVLEECEAKKGKPCTLAVVEATEFTELMEGEMR